MPVGEVWKERLSLGGDPFYGIARSAGLGRWVCCGGPAPGVQRVYTAEDADLDDWTSRVVSGTDQLLGVASDDASQFIICGYDTIKTSSDGISWGSYGVAGSPILNNVVFGPTSLPGDLFMFAGNEIWRQTTPSGLFNFQVVDATVTFMADIAVNPTTQRWVGVGGYVVGRATYSDGGLATTWGSAEYTLSNDGRFWGIDYANGLFVAVGDGGIIFTSADGWPYGTWTQQVSGTAGNFRAVAWCGTHWVAVGLAGLVATSPDAVSWTLQDSGVLNDLYDIDFDPVAQIALVSGSEGLILSSFEGDRSPGPLAPSVVDPSNVGEDGGYLLNLYANFEGQLGKEFEVFIGPGAELINPKALTGIPGRPTTAYPLNVQRIQVYSPLLEVGTHSVFVQRKDDPTVYGFLKDGLQVYKRDFKTQQYHQRSVWAPIWYVGPRSIEQEDPV